MFDPLLPLSELFPKSILTLQVLLVRRRMLCYWNTTRRKRRRHESQDLGQFFLEFSCWNSPVVESQLVGDGHESWTPYVKYSYSGVWCIPTHRRSLEWGTVEVIRTVPQSYRVYLHHLHKDGRISLNSHWMACARTYRISNINFRRSSTRWRNNKSPSFGSCAFVLSGCHTGILMRPNISFWLKGARQGTNSLMLHFGKQHRWWTEKRLEPQTMLAVFLAHWLTQTQLQYNEEMKELQVYVSVNFDLKVISQTSFSIVSQPPRLWRLSHSTRMF